MKVFKISSSDTNRSYIELDLDDRNSSDWVKAIKIFRDRFETRFFRPLKILLDNSDKRIKFYNGFTVVAIDCILIETFNQFLHGINETDDTFKNKHCAFFKDFFQNSEFFKNDFDSDEKVAIFYSHIRCGLLHQGETKGETLINLKNEKQVVKFLDNNGEKSIELNRELFHERVESFFYDYVAKLNDANNTKLRENFKDKMDYITRKKAIPKKR